MNLMAALWGQTVRAGNAPTRAQESDLRVIVYVFNSADASARELAAAEAHVKRIFASSGITLDWKTGVTARRAAAIGVGEEWNEADLDLRIWRHSLAEGMELSPDALGYCLSIEKSQAVVLYDAIQNLAVVWGTEVGDVLGLAMAHEIGHLLLKSAAHSAGGVMVPRFLQAQLVTAERGSLTFTRNEGSSMQAEVRRRMRVQMLARSKPPSDSKNFLPPARIAEGSARGTDKVSYDQRFLPKAQESERSQ